MKKSITMVLVAGGLLAMASLLTTQAYAESASPTVEEWARIATETAQGFQSSR